MLQIARNVHNQIACKSKLNHLIALEHIALPFGFLLAEPFLFQREMLEALKRNIDVELAEHVSKYFSHNASQWLLPKNVALSDHLEVPPFCIEAVKVPSFPDTVDTKAF